jgi:hypothetical protein
MGWGGVVGVRGGRAIHEVSGSFQGEWIEDGEKKVGVSTGTVPETIVMTKAILHLRLGGTDPATRAFPLEVTPIITYFVLPLRLVLIP